MKRARAPEIVEHTSDDDAETSEEEDAPEDHDDLQEAEEEEEQAAVKKRGKISISLAKSQDVCRVCGQPGHKAGFVGSVYMDCLNKPCYLCKQPGHTTSSCPFRLQPGLHAKPASDQSNAASSSLLASLIARQVEGRRVLPSRTASIKPPAYKVKAAILKLHSRRVGCIEFHPTKHHLVLSGDKKGQIAAWNMDTVKERTMYLDTHKYLMTVIKALPWLDDAAFATSSCDGTVKVLDIETGLHKPLLDMNPAGYTTDKEWRMVYSGDASAAFKMVMVGDNDGFVHFLDPRVRGAVSAQQLHKKGNKVTSIHCHPVDGNLMASAGNDHVVRLFDIRRLTSNGDGTGSSNGSGSGRTIDLAPAGPVTPSTTTTAGGKAGSSSGKKASSGGGGRSRGAHPAELVALQHPRVVNSAHFSPLTGRRLLTTCIDNKLRVWDDVSRLSSGVPEDRMIVHSHDFSRYLTPFKAEFDPKDPNESRFIIGRYISEDFGGVALHPVDMLDASTGELLQEMIDYNLLTICPVNKAHPCRDLVVSGSSRSLFLWAPDPDDDDDVAEEQEEKGDQAVGRAGSSSGAAAGGAPGGQGGPRSFRYTFFDADPGGGGDGKKKGGAKGKGKAKGKGAPMDDGDDDDD